MELHEPITFAQNSFRETSLREEPDPAVRYAVVPLHGERAFFFTGAGSSAGTPTGLPTGPQLAAKLVAWAHESGAGAAVDALKDPSDLGQVCAALETALDRDSVVRHIRKVVEWRSAKINLCHLAIALLYAEGLLRISFTANWDPELEDAPRPGRLPETAAGCRDEATMGRGRHRPLPRASSWSLLGPHLAGDDRRGPGETERDQVDRPDAEGGAGSAGSDLRRLRSRARIR